MRFASAAVTLLFAPTIGGSSSSSSSSRSNCFSDTDSLNLAIEAKSFEDEETFILCPNTVFTIGFPVFVDGEFTFEGPFPIDLRGNTKIKCGNDGKSENSCILTSGQFQIISTIPSFDREPKVNMEVEGVTFEYGGNAGALLVAAGDVTFTDCVFKNHSNTGAVSLLFFRRRSRYLKGGQEDWDEFLERALTDPQVFADYREAIRHESAIAADHHDVRGLQDDDPRQVVTFKKCLFEGNTAGPPSLAINYAVIGVETDTNDLIIEDCIFRNNDFSGAPEGEDTQAIEVVAGSTIKVTDTCFLNNDFRGNGTVKLESADSIVTLNNNFGTADDDLICEFVSAGGDCIDYDKDECGDSSSDSS